MANPVTYPCRHGMDGGCPICQGEASGERARLISEAHRDRAARVEEALIDRLASAEGLTAIDVAHLAAAIRDLDAVSKGWRA